MLDAVGATTAGIEGERGRQSFMETERAHNDRAVAEIQVALVLRLADPNNISGEAEPAGEDVVDAIPAPSS